jgi:hypothetical protein
MKDKDWETINQQFADMENIFDNHVSSMINFLRKEINEYKLATDHQISTLHESLNVVTGQMYLLTHIINKRRKYGRKKK